MPKVRGNAAKQREETKNRAPLQDTEQTEEGKNGHEERPQDEGPKDEDTVHSERKEDPKDEPSGKKRNDKDMQFSQQKDDEADEKAVPQEERVDQEEDAEAANAPKRVKRARAGTNDYWVGLARESGVSVQSVRKVHDGIRKLAARQLQNEDMSGPFELQGIAKFTVKKLQHRAYKKQVYGKQVNVSEIKPQRKIFVKSMLGVQGLAE